MNSRLRGALLIALGLASIHPSMLVQTASAQTATEEFSIDLARQPVRTALNELSRQTKVQVLLQSEADVSNLNIGPLKGRHTLESALRALLNESGLSFRRINDRTVAIIAAAPNSTRIRSLPATAGAGHQFMQMAARGDDKRSAARTRITKPTAPLESDEEVIVTGTHLRGLLNSATPVSSFMRRDIEQSGYATVYQFLQTLPQNFGGGANENSASMTASPGGSYTQGTGVNLRGLGTASTLVLLNGHRLAPAGFGEFVDVSIIPESAVERVDVMTDSGSAVYGSDAVGGVVNVILRDNYDEAETRLRYGTTPDGGAEQVASQTLGAAWDSGNIIGGYEYYQRDPVAASDRDYTSAAPALMLLLPEQTRHSGFISATQEIGERVRVFGQGIYSQRDFNATVEDLRNPLPALQVGDVTQYGATLGSIIDIGEVWQLEVAGSLNQSESFNQNVTLPDRTLFGRSQNDFQILQFDAKVDGTLWQMSGGETRAAVGVSHRNEDFSAKSLGAALDVDRDVEAVFAEVNVPFFGKNNSRPGLRRLQLTLAARYEDYSDFGSDLSPKYGLLWSPVDRIDLRATYGESFRAPSFVDLDETINLDVVLPVPSPTAGFEPVLIRFGNNAHLNSERAQTWTLGTDLRLSATPGISASLTYFNIDYRDRIGPPTSDCTSALTNGAAFGPYVLNNPSLPLLQSYASSPIFLNPLELPLESVVAIADCRMQNASTSTVSGVDAAMLYSQPVAKGTLGFRIAGTYLTAYDFELTQTSGTQALINTVYNPIDLRLRAEASWSSDALGAAVFLNYVDNYKDERGVTPVEVGSWTTLDANVSYQFSNANAWLAGTLLSFNVINLFDNDPPYVVDTLNNVHFDGANANVLGRFVSFGISKRW